MKKILRSVLDWLDRKFPDKVVVTQKDYETLNARLRYLESEVTKFNASLGFMGVRGNNTGMDPKTAVGPFQR